MINHGHIKVNKKRVNISSYVVKDSDLIEVREKSKKIDMLLMDQYKVKKEKFQNIFN